MIYCHLYLVLFLVLVNTTLAANTVDSTLGLNQDLELQSILIDETHSKIANDFYDAFYKIWEFPVIRDPYTIIISEKTSPGLGTMIVIKINDEDILSQFLQANYDFIQEFAESCSIYLRQYLEIYKEIQLELQGKDLKGTGIY